MSSATGLNPLTTGQEGEVATGGLNSPMPFFWKFGTPEIVRLTVVSDSGVYNSPKSFAGHPAIPLFTSCSELSPAQIQVPLKSALPAPAAG